jgi:methylthioribose-1-phosphate isomerase
MIRTLYWQDNTVVMIDQKALPQTERYLVFKHYEQVVAAINDLTVRGAPAIGVAAALGIALGVSQLSASNRKQFDQTFYQICEAFSRTRPTARNLFWAIEKMVRCFKSFYSSSPTEIKDRLIREAVRICEEDIAINRRMGAHGRLLIEDGDRLLTHCNAGALATAGYGTALGVIRAAHDEGKALHVYVDETRPVLQGARLTAWELIKEKIPATLIADNMAGFLMSRGRIDRVIVGADRIAANGDTANKIGTYSLSVLAKTNKIPFYIAAPLSTIDISVKTGADIPIEERNPEEVTSLQGIRIAPEGIDVYNPAFDVTPHRFITAIITEAGVIFPPFTRNIRKLIRTSLK